MRTEELAIEMISDITNLPITPEAHDLSIKKYYYQTRAPKHEFQEWVI